MKCCRDWFISILMACCSALVIDQLVRSNYQNVSASFHLTIYLVELSELIRLRHGKMQFTSEYVFSKLQIKCLVSLSFTVKSISDGTFRFSITNFQAGYPCYVSNNNTNNFMSQNQKAPTPWKYAPLRHTPSLHQSPIGPPFCSSAHFYRIIYNKACIYSCPIPIELSDTRRTNKILTTTWERRK